MRCWWLLVPGLLVACESGGSATDAAVDEAAPRCDPAQPFGAPRLVLGINTDADDATARLSPDETEIAFARRTSGVWDLWRATRAADDGPFESPVLLTTVNSVSSDLWPSVSPDGLTVFFDADRTTPGTFHIWRSTRSSTAVPFGPPMPRPELMDRDLHPLVANQTALYLTSTVRGGFGGADLFRAALDPSGMIGAPVALVGGVNTAMDEESPALTADERVIYFRRSDATLSDIYTASRSTATDGFGTSSPVPGLDVAGVGETPNWVSPDNCRLYFHSNADSGGGPAGLNVWMVTRPPT
ncbi:MAG: PD40 domain-containing protein [Deltaproteobacteria bacterium]|nr:PD40 domain-containing protein [Deltaproteobacteria bacterium]